MQCLAEGRSVARPAMRRRRMVLGLQRATVRDMALVAPIGRAWHGPDRYLDGEFTANRPLDATATEQQLGLDQRDFTKGSCRSRLVTVIIVSGKEPWAPNCPWGSS